MRAGGVNLVPVPGAVLRHAVWDDEVAIHAPRHDVGFALVDAASGSGQGEQVVVMAQGQQVSIQQGDFVVSVTQIAIGPQAQGVQAGEDVGEIRPFAHPRMGHKNLLDVNHKIIQLGQRLPRRAADLLGDHANQIRFRFLAAQAVGQQQHAGQVAVVEHEEGDKGVVGTAVGLAHGSG